MRLGVYFFVGDFFKLLFVLDVVKLPLKLDGASVAPLALDLRLYDDAPIDDVISDDVMPDGVIPEAVVLERVDWVTLAVSWLTSTD